MPTTDGDGGAARARLTTLVDAACLAHAMRGVSLTIVTTAGATLHVASTALGADLSPCQFRHLLTSTHAERVVIDRIARVGISSGAVHLGGGLYQRSRPQAGDERWFATALVPDTIAQLIADSHADLADDRFGVALRSDEQLGRTAVCVHALEGRTSPEIDEISTRLVAACLVEELLDDVSATQHVGGDTSP